MSEGNTRERLLDAAERLYADHGVDATSLRAVTAEAGANIAAVNYHFGSKQGLTEAVFSRRIVPLNAERLRRLDELESAAAAALSPEDIVEAFVTPAMRVSRDPERGGEKFLRLMGRIYTEPGGGLGALLAEQFQEVVGRFTTALARVLPDLPPEELMWRFHFMIGAMIHTVADPAKLKRFTGGVCNTDDVDQVRERLVTFICGGLRAPVPHGERRT